MIRASLTVNVPASVRSSFRHSFQEGRQLLGLATLWRNFSQVLKISHQCHAHPLGPRISPISPISLPGRLLWGSVQLCQGLIGGMDRRPPNEHMGKYGKINGKTCLNLQHFTTHIWIFIVYMDIGGPQKTIRFSPNAGALRNTKMSTRRLVDPGQHTLYLGRGGYMGDTTKCLVSGGKSHGLWMVYSWKLGFKWMMTGKYPYHSVSFRISGNLHMTCWDSFFRDSGTLALGH